MDTEEQEQRAAKLKVALLYLKRAKLRVDKNLEDILSCDDPYCMIDRIVARAHEEGRDVPRATISKRYGGADG
jgi:hypothetical protein